MARDDFGADTPSAGIVTFQARLGGNFEHQELGGTARLPRKSEQVHPRAPFERR